MKVEIAWAPNEGPQTEFLRSSEREVLYGGAAGGGKSDALLVLPLYRMAHPKHRSILLRRTRPQLQEIIDRAQWMYPIADPGVRWQEDKSRFVWSSGAITQFGYMEHEQDKLKFKTFEFDLICFDELTSFSEGMYLYLFSRNRTKSHELPPLMRAGTNPGDIGHQFVFERFIEGKLPFVATQHETIIEEPGEPSRRVLISRQFIPASVWDNPKMPGRDDYVSGLKQMSEADQSALLDGNWFAFSGQLFPRKISEVPIRKGRPGEYLARGMDYGWNDHTAVLWAWVNAEKRTIELAGETYVRHTLPAEVAAMIHAMERHLGATPRISVCSPDAFRFQPIGQQTIADLFQAHQVWFQRANNDRIAGWTRVAGLLHEGRVTAQVGQAPNLVRTLPLLVRSKANVNDAIAKGVEDHAPEAFRYLVMAIPELGEVAIDQPLPEQAPPVDNVFERLLASAQELSGGGQGGIIDEFTSPEDSWNS